MSEIENPYPGLRPFEAGQAHLFFGRDAQCDELLGRLARHRFVAVVGSSGSGKSSLARAGLLPSLEGGFLAGAGSTWRIALMRPGTDAIENLAAALNGPEEILTPLAPLSGAERGEQDSDSPSPPRRGGWGVRIPDFTATTLRRGPLGLIEAASLAGLGEGENLLVVVDQFEELFRFARRDGETPRDEGAAFVRLLLEAVAQEAVPIYVVLTLRSDYIGECSRYPELAGAISSSQFLVPRLTRDQLKAAIEGPAAVGGAAVAPRLLQRLLGDVGENSDQLPLLQHALMRTWESWQAAGAAGPIDLPHYERTGGTQEALSLHADEAWAELDDEGRRVARLLFRSLTEKGEDQRGVRRPTELAEIAAAAAVAAAAVAAVVEVFRRPGRSFLMPPAGTALEPSTMLDLSHESLMRVWKRLRDWVDQEGAAAARYRRLAESARLFAAGEAGLLRDPELAAATAWWQDEKPTAAWAGRYGGDFGATAGFFERSRRRARWIARIQFAALPVVITVLLAAIAWRAQSRATAEVAAAEAKVATQQQEIARLEDQRAELSSRVAAVGSGQEQRQAQMELLRRDKRALGDQIALQKGKNAELSRQVAIQRAQNTLLGSRAADLRQEAAALQKAVVKLRDRGPELDTLLRENRAAKACLLARLESRRTKNRQLRGAAGRLGLPLSFDKASMSSNGGPPPPSPVVPVENSDPAGETLRTQVAELETLLGQLEAAAALSQQELEGLRQETALLSALLGELRRQAAKLEAEAGRLAAEEKNLHLEIGRLEQEIAGGQREKVRLETAMAEPEKECRQLSSELGLLRGQLNRLDDQNYQLADEIGRKLEGSYAARAVDPALDPQAAAVLALLAFLESRSPEDPQMILLLTASLQRLDPPAAAALSQEVLGDPQEGGWLEPRQLAEALCRSRPRLDAAAWTAAAPAGLDFDPAAGDPCRRLAETAQTGETAEKAEEPPCP